MRHVLAGAAAELSGSTKSSIGIHDVTVTIAFALAAALANGIHLMTQHSVSIGVSGQHRGWALVTFLFRQPLWLLGCGRGCIGFAFQGSRAPADNSRSSRRSSS